MELDTNWGLHQVLYVQRASEKFRRGCAVPVFGVCRHHNKPTMLVIFLCEMHEASDDTLLGQHDTPLSMTTEVSARYKFARDPVRAIRDEIREVAVVRPSHAPDLPLSYKELASPNSRSSGAQTALHLFLPFVVSVRARALTLTLSAVTPDLHAERRSTPALWRRLSEYQL